MEGFHENNAQSNNLWLLRRRPDGFFDDDFDSSETFAPPIIIGIADAYQLFAITFEEVLCAFLTESQCPPRFHKRPSWLLEKTATD